MNAARHEKPANLSTTRKRVIAIGVPALAGLAAAAAIGLPHLTGAQGETTGKVPSIESCAPETAQAIGHEACATAVQIAGDVVANKAPKDMHATEATRGFTTLFGKPAYTITQKAVGDVNPVVNQTYSVTFGMKGDKADLSNIVEIKGDNGDNLAVIDHTKQGRKDVYAAGFHDPEAPVTPIVHSDAHVAEDATAAAMRAFVPPQQ